MELRSPAAVTLQAKDPGERHVEDKIKDTIDQLAQSLQIVTLLSTQLRRELSASAQEAVDLEAAADKAIRAVRRLQPPNQEEH